METLLPVIANLACGAIAGVLAGILLKRFSLGIAGNSLAGLVGASVAGYIFSATGIGILGGLSGQAFAGCVGGAALMAVTGFLRQRSAG